ncbi:MAG TPA: M23 family metallopeptidase, partial [Anaerolineae bacterium]|nr:M23 family metallopeptidase [Anaerolineae bacterium]
KLLILGLISVAGLYLLYQAAQFFTFLWDRNDPRSQTFVQWAAGNQDARESLVTIQREACPGAPFILPADGFIGLLYEDPRGPYSRRRPHQGIDIFSNTEPGVTPVYAAYDGYVTREDDWRSALIMRVPDDPLQPGRQIWLYYAHMADRAGSSFIVDAFPPGTREKFVEQGTLLGYTGDYNGNSPRGVWVHLHFSIVRDDGNGRYRNELDFDNTLDPSPYLGMTLNYYCDGQPGCGEKVECSSGASAADFAD